MKRQGMRGARGALTICLVALASVLAVMAVFTIVRVVEKGGGLTLPLVILIGLAFLGLAATWIAFTVLDGHFRDIARLRADLLTAASIGTPLPKRWLGPSDADVEISGLARVAAEALLDRTAARSLPDERLAAVVAAAAEGLVVVTENGLVSLVNAAALSLLGADRLAVGTSVYAAFDRESLAALTRQARERGEPVRGIARTAGGEDLEVRVADLGHHGGSVVSLPGAGEAVHPAVLHHDLALHDRPPPERPAAPETLLEELSLVVMDSETTGLDVTRDRIVSIGAVRLHGRRIFPDINMDVLVHPRMPIPPRSTAVHGISDEMVADAPAIGTRLAALRELIGSGAVVGHNIGFDLTILSREAERAGVAWTPPLSLDTGHLMAVLEPELRELDLDVIAERLGVDVEGRHTALGDAIVTAEIFVRLLPRLRDAGVSTLGEAQDFAARAERLRAPQKAAGWEI